MSRNENSTNKGYNHRRSALSFPHLVGDYAGWWIRPHLSDELIELLHSCVMDDTEEFILGIRTGICRPPCNPPPYSYAEIDEHREVAEAKMARWREMP